MPRVAEDEAGRKRAHYVYILKSESHQKQTYVGFTSDLKKRLAKHNQGGSPHTAKYKSWTLTHYSAFNSEEKARDFEKYLKSHSGKAFAAKRLM